MLPPPVRRHDGAVYTSRGPWPAGQPGACGRRRSPSSPAPGGCWGGDSYFSGSKPVPVAVAVAVAVVAAAAPRRRRSSALLVGPGRAAARGGAGPSGVRRRSRSRPLPPPLVAYLPKNAGAGTASWAAEVAAELALGLVHVGAPDLRRERAAGDVGAVVEPEHLHALLGVADPDRGREARREADEPRVGELVRGAGLAGRRAADRRLGAGAALRCSARGSRSPWRSRRPRTRACA